MPGQSGFADINGTQLAYESVGDGPPLVLIHGLGVDRRIWDLQVDSLAGNHRIIRYDVRGSGGSALPAPEVPYSHADDLAALLAHLGVVTAHVLGQSQGGEIAIDLALTYPQIVKALVLVDTSLGGYEMSAEYLRSWDAVRGAIRRGDLHGAIPLILDHALHLPLSQRPQRQALLRELLESQANRPSVDPTLWQRPSPPAVEVLESIRMPVLVVVAERDLPDFHAIAELLVSRIAGARLERIGGVGHVVPLEAPDRLTQLVLGFLATTRS